MKIEKMFANQKRQIEINRSAFFDFNWLFYQLPPAPPPPKEPPPKPPKLPEPELKPP